MASRYNYNAGELGSGLLLTGPQAPAGGTTDYPVYGTGVNQGLVVSRLTGQPFSGKDANGKEYRAGKEVTPPPGQQFIPGTTTPIDPNNASQRYKAVEIPKNPGVASATDALLESFKKSADASLQDFSAYKSEFQNEMKSALDKSRAATDISGYTADVTGQQQQYAGALDAALGGATGANANTAAREDAALKNLRDGLAGYDQAAQDVANYQLQQLNGQVNRYKLAKGGGNLGLGSDELAMQAAGARAIQLPVSLEKVRARQNITQNVELPMIDRQGSRENQVFQNFAPSVAGNKFNSGQAVSNAVQQLKIQTAGMSYQAAMQYMQSLGVPEQIQQQILSGQLGNLGAINALKSGSTYQGLQDILGTSVTQPVGSTPSFGGLPVPNYTAPNYNPVTSTGTGGYGGYDPTFGSRLNEVNRINASRYTPPNAARYGAPNARGPYDTPSGYADYNQPYVFEELLPQSQI